VIAQLLGPERAQDSLFECGQVEAAFVEESHDQPVLHDRELVEVEGVELLQERAVEQVVVVEFGHALEGHHDVLHRPDAQIQAVVDQVALHGRQVGFVVGLVEEQCVAVGQPTRFNVVQTFVFMELNE